MDRTLGGLAKKYTSSDNPRWATLALRTREIYRAGIVSLNHLLPVRVDKITRPMVIDLRDRYFHSPGKCRVALETLSNILSFAYDKGLVEVNVAYRIKGQPKPTPIKRWSEKEIEAFIEKAPDRLKEVVMLAYYTGQRRSDLVNMKWEDYDGHTIHVIQKKTGKELYIPVHPRLKKVLDGINKSSAFILNKKDGDRWQPDHLTNEISRHAKAMGMDLTIHGLRKSTASVLAEMGCTPHEIQPITGHSIKELINYTKQAEQSMLAKKAMEKWK